jgi:CRP-like cAMP-binding protein
VSHPLVRKLECFAPLSAKEKRAIERLTAVRTSKLGPKTALINEGVKPRYVKVVLDGWCCRSKVLENGRRQIVAFLLPGDLTDFNILVLRRMDHSIISLTDVTYAQLTGEMIDELAHTSPTLMKALWWESLMRESMQREWTLNLGQRTALQRVAHLMCELFVRQRTLGVGDDGTVPFPVTQADLGDAAGMSIVHVNRTLQELRSKRLISLRGGALTVPDLDRLAAAAMFNPNYLHLYGTPANRARVGPPETVAG